MRSGQGWIQAPPLLVSQVHWIAGWLCLPTRCSITVLSPDLTFPLHMVFVSLYRFNRNPENSIAVSKILMRTSSQYPFNISTKQRIAQPLLLHWWKKLISAFRDLTATFIFNRNHVLKSICTLCWSTLLSHKHILLFFVIVITAKHEIYNNIFSRYISNGNL